MAPPGVQRVATAVLQVPEGRARGQADEDRLGPAPSDDAVTDAAGPHVAVAAAPPAIAAAPHKAAAPAFAADDMRLRVARLGIDLPLLHGDVTRDTVLGATPNGAAFLLPTSAPPGSGGNSYIYAHARAGMFLLLWDVRLGDVVELTLPPNEVRRYVVTEIHPRVVPTDVHHTLPTADERITLQTSTGPRDADPRFVVVAVRRD